MFDRRTFIKTVALVQLNVIILNANLICDYKFNRYYGYSCSLSVNQSAIDVDDVLNISGTHLGMKNDNDVVFIDSSGLILDKFPLICPKFDSVIRVALYGIGLQRIDPDDLQKCALLRVLLLDNNNLTKTSARMFQGNLVLEELNMSNNKINQLHPETFSGLDTLETLFLHKNQIKVLHAEVFAPLKSLKLLNLESNNINKISPETFKQTLNLELLSVQGNQLKRINANAFGSLRQLNNLNLAFNNIEEIHNKVFDKLPSLKILYLNGNVCSKKIFWSVVNVSLEIIPSISECLAKWNERSFKFANDEIYSCTLHGLELTSSREDDEIFNESNFVHEEGKANRDVVKVQATDSIINFLPVSLMKMFENLKYFEFDNVKLLQIARDSLRNCSQLEITVVKRNRVERLEGKTFADCSNLQRIILFNNQISSIDVETFWQLRKLKYLDLSYNNLIEIPEAAFDTLSTLETLNLAGNRIESLSESLFHSLDELKVLRLHSNRIKTLSSNAFMNLNKLEEMHLQHNLIKTFQPGTFRNAIKLKYLNVENNFIEYLHSNMFVDILNLNYFDISSNSISFLDVNLFKKIPRLELLFAVENLCINKNFEIEGALNNFVTHNLLECFSII